MAEIIVALDFDVFEEAREWVNNLKSEIKFFKIGLQLFTRFGPKAVEMVRGYEREVFLDLKVFDIPKICRKTAEFAAGSGCYSMTMHIMAGDEGMRYAKEGQVDGRPHIWGVTMLSSSEGGGSLEMAGAASKNALEGVIVSGADVRKVKDKYPGLEIVTPGIRPEGYGKKDDQKKILTPKDAVEAGSDFLVIGRPIIESGEPLALIKKIKESIKNG